MSTEREAGYLVVETLTKRFGEVAAVDDVAFSLRRGEILALLGPSGSGKTTTLRLLAGFETADAGRILVDGEDVTRVSPAARRFGMVFQHYALFPHLNVGGNVAFGLESLGVHGETLQRRVAEALKLVELDGYQQRQVSELSGGQQQRVALARALAPEPRVLLLDEPLSNLDPTLRERTRREIRRVIHRVGITTVIVTHEQDEAFDLGDTVAVLRAGRVEQVGTPDDLYARPANPFVAGFVGRSTGLDVTVVEAGPSGSRVRLAEGDWTVAGASPVASGGKALLVVRPEAVRLTPPNGASVTGRVLERRFTGAEAFFTIALSDGRTIEVSDRSGAARVDDTVGLVPVDGGLHLFPPGAK